MARLFVSRLTSLLSIVTAMGSAITTPSASICPDKFIQAAKNFYGKMSSLFLDIKKRIKDSGDAVVAAVRSIEVDLLKEALDVFDKGFTLLIGSIFALKLTDTRKAFFSANYSVMKAMFLLIFVSCLTKFLATLSQMHTRNMAPLLVMLLLDSGTSLLALSMISRPILWTSVVLWLCIFMLLGYCCFPELKEQILQIKTWIWNHNPEGEYPPVDNDHRGRP